MAERVTQELRDQVGAIFKKASEAVGLKEKDQALILGSTEGQLDRVALFLGIYEEAGRLFGDPGPWLKAPNRGEAFEGKPPLDFILEDPERNLRSTLQYLRGATGGWA